MRAISAARGDFGSTNMRYGVGKGFNSKMSAQIPTGLLGRFTTRIGVSFSDGNPRRKILRCPCLTGLALRIVEAFSNRQRDARAEYRASAGEKK